MNKFDKEYELDKLCPCGSGKKYKYCCKNKSIRWEYKDGKLFKSVPVEKGFLQLVENQINLFESMYNRKPKDEDRLFFNNFFYKGQYSLTLITELKESGISEALIYAFWKTGLFVCEENIDKISDKDIDEFYSYVDEYNELMIDDIDDRVNIILFAKFANDMLHKTFLEVVEYLKSTINDFMIRHFENDSFIDYEISSVLDYYGFSLYKLYKNLDTIKFLEDNNQTESIYAIGRGIFENYLYAHAIYEDISLFNEKILPKAKDSQYTFLSYPDGRINYNVVVNNATEEHKNIKITTSSLKKYLTNKYDIEIYNVFYTKACQYIHMDILSAKSYFVSDDPFISINSSYISGIIVLTIALLLLKEISRSNVVDKQYRKDFNQLYDNIKEKLIVCFEMLMSDEENNNLIYLILLNRLKI